MDAFFALCAGTALAAACGFRIFVPLFIASLAANLGVDVSIFGHTSFDAMLGTNYAWLGDDWITLALGVATVVEIGSYYLPWVDNLLDSIATPAAVIAGVVISSALMPEVVGDGALKWLLSLILGGGTSGLVQTATVLTRGASTLSTGGVGNPVVSTGELGAATATASLAILLPVLAVVLVIAVAVFLIRSFRRRRAGHVSAG